MQQQKTQSKYAPIRVRIRQPEKSQSVNGHQQNGHESITPSLPTAERPSDERRANQIRELLRLGRLLRAGLGLNDFLSRVATSIRDYTGFRIVVVNLIEEGNDYISVTTSVGISEEGERVLRETPMSVEQVRRQMLPDFRISNSYFIPHEHQNVLVGATLLVPDIAIQENVTNAWHPENYFFIPLVSTRADKLLGYLSLDDPADGKIPTLEDIEVLELFAQKASLAIDNVNVYREREKERIDLEESITELREDMQRVRGGDLSTRVRTTHAKLKPIGDAINTMLCEMSTIVGNAQQVVQAVNEHTHSMEYTAELLIHDSEQQEQQVKRISQVIDTFANVIHQVADSATNLAQMAAETTEMTHSGQNVVDVAIDGMGKVREATQQTERTMKHLGESGQEVNETVNAITDLTARMHLLALNAAIEASHSNENGSGFMVVAQEIRNLSLFCAEASRKVSTYVRTFQQETAQVAESVGQNTQQVVDQTELVTQTGLMLYAIDASTVQIANLVQSISTLAENQAQNSRHVVHASGEIQRMTSEINTHMREVRQSASHLKELTNSLRSRLAFFRVGSESH
jgi:methyl-accepting chemotaxis protein